MKTFILIILVTMLFSCQDDLLITKTYGPICVNDKVCNDHYTVNKIENYRSSLCRYYLTSDSWLDFDYNISFIDSIGKFKIAEKLYVSFDKVK